VGSGPEGVAVTPDGKFGYVTNEFSNTVSVIVTATNTVVATVPVGSGPSGVGIIPDVPFVGFGANLVLAFGGAGNQDFLPCKPTSS
jgi:YVTN family beta-propeller protein